ncbi:LTA synthase family protein [Acidaminobacterium chupaoyuni]
MSHKKPIFAALDPNSAEQPRKGVLWAYSFVALTALSVAMGVASLLFATGGFGKAMFESYWQNPLLLALNLLPPVLLSWIFTFLLGRCWAGFFTSSSLVAAATLANYFKLALRDDPLLAEDLGLISEAAGMAGNYSIQLTAAMWKLVLCILFGTALLYCCCPGVLRVKWKRITASAVSGAVFAALIFGVYCSGEVYAKTANEASINVWSDTQQYVSRGFLYPFLHSLSSTADPAPEGYSVKEAQRLLAQYQQADIPQDQRVSVISVMLEAFSDFSQYDAIQFKRDVYQTWHQLQSEGYSGQLVTNIFAGGTVDTERSYLTGFPSLGSFRTASWAYPRYFADQGYTVEGAHPSYEWFYNRVNINRNLGFENYYFMENYFGTLTDEEVATDDIFFPQLRKLYEENAQTGKPYFNFSVTYQNHGPYDDSVNAYGRQYATAPGLSQTGKNILNNYLGGVEDTLEHLGDFVDSFRESDQPVILVFFGDHKPWLGDDSYVYSQLGIDLLGDTEKDFYDYYTTPFVIWANDAAKKTLGKDFSGESEPISPCFLMNKVFEQAGWQGPAYLQSTGSLMQTLPVVQSTGRRVENGALVTAVSPEAEEKMRENRILRYYLRKDALKQKQLKTEDQME